MACCVRGYHVYKDIWAAAVGEVLASWREPSNASDRYAIAVLKHERIIGHLPRKILKVCLFLREGSIRCTVTGSMATKFSEMSIFPISRCYSDRWNGGGE